MKLSKGLYVMRIDDYNWKSHILYLTYISNPVMITMEDTKSIQYVDPPLFGKGIVSHPSIDGRLIQLIKLIK